MTARSPAPASERLRRLVTERTGLGLDGARHDTFVAALDRDARAARARGPEEHAEALLDGSAPLAAFVEELTVGETWFFRDPAQWAFVEGVVVPDALRRRGAGPERFRAWSAGCATGEEPYTLAMVLAELGVLDAASISATDLNEAALARARLGAFSLWSLRGDVAGRARRHLVEAGDRFVLEPGLAARVRFFGLNLADRTYPSPSRGLADLDLVLCRNVLIYLDRARVADVARRLFECLAPGGWVLVGAADPILARLAPFEVRTGPFGLAYRRPDERAAPERGRRAVPAALAPAPRTAAGAPGPGAPHRPPPAPSAPRAANVPRAAATPAPAAPAGPSVAAARGLLDAGRLGEALAEIDAVLAGHPLDAEAHFERAVVLTELGRRDEAEDACRRALYLGRGQPFIHFFVAVLRLARGDRAGATGSFRTAAMLAARLPPDAVVPLSHGLTAGALAEAARRRIDGGSGDGPGPGGR